MIRRLALAALCFAAPALAQAPDFDKVEIRTQALAPGIAVLFGEGGNIGVSAGPDGTILIDDQFAPLTAKIVAAVAAMGAPPVRFVLDTHFHFDHTGGNENFGKAGAVLIAQDNVRRRLVAGGLVRAAAVTIPPAPAAALPVATFGDGMTMHLNGDTLSLIHVANAHTDGDTIVKFRKANIIHTGDVYVRYGLPFIDTDGGGSIQGMIAGCDRILALSDAKTRIIPGHGEVATRADVAEFRAMLATIRDRVAAGIRAGKPLAVIKASKPAAQWDKDPKAFITGDAFVATIYANLKAPVLKRG